VGDTVRGLGAHFVGTTTGPISLANAWTETNCERRDDPAPPRDPHPCVFVLIQTNIIHDDFTIICNWINGHAWLRLVWIIPAWNSIKLMCVYLLDYSWNTISKIQTLRGVDTHAHAIFSCAVSCGSLTKRRLQDSCFHQHVNRSSQHPARTNPAALIKPRPDQSWSCDRPLTPHVDDPLRLNYFLWFTKLL
jgi:hypothetical protein